MVYIHIVWITVILNLAALMAIQLVKVFRVLNKTGTGVI